MVKIIILIIFLTITRTLYSLVEIVVILAKMKLNKIKAFN